MNRSLAHPSFSMSSPLARYGALLLLLLAVVACLWPGMQSPLFTDDIFQVKHSNRLGSWTDSFGRDAFGFYRPVKNLLFMAAAPHEGNLVVWHWFGLVAYLAATVAVHRIVTICLGSPRAAFLAAAVWALSPTCVSTALWLSCANISIGLVFAALAFHFHERSHLRGSVPSFLLAAAAYVLSLFCYESLIALPGLLFLRDLQQKRLRIDRASLGRYAAFTVVCIGFLALRHHASATTIGRKDFHAGFAPDTQPHQLCLSAAWFLWRHFLMWVFPFGKIELLGSYAWMRSVSVAGIVASWFFLAGLLATAGFLWKRLPAVSYGILFFLVASFPAGNFLPAFNGPINDAYLTIPSIGLAIAFAAACERLFRIYQTRRREGDSGLVAIAIVLCLLGAYRLPLAAAYSRYWADVWSEPARMMLLVAETRPVQFQPKSFAAVILQAHGYSEQSDILARETLEEAPWSNLAMLTLGRNAQLRGDHATAEMWLRRTLECPNLKPIVRKPTLLDLATIISHDPARAEEAATICRTLLQQDAAGEPPDTILLLARIYKDQGNLPKARTTLERGLTIHPGDRSIGQMLASLPAAAIAPAGAAAATNP